MIRATGEALKIGEVAQTLGISASMIRAWEKLGIIRPGRTDSAYRLYSQEDVHILRRAVYLRRVNGLNAPAILNQLRQEGLLPRSNNGAGAEMHIGPRLRKLRLQGESPSVAKTLNISVGFLSNLERSQSGASVGSTHKLAQYYGANILELFNSPAADGPLVREDGRKVLQGGAGVRMELLGLGADHHGAAPVPPGGWARGERRNLIWHGKGEGVPLCHLQAQASISFWKAGSINCVPVTAFISRAPRSTAGRIPAGLKP